MNKPINFNIAVKVSNLVVYFLEENKQPQMIGEFTLPKKFELQKSVISAVYFGEKIDSCENLKCSNRDLI